MKIRVVVPFGGYRAGQEFDWADGMARILIARRLIERVDAPVEAAVVEQRSETAMIDTKSRKRQQK